MTEAACAFDYLPVASDFLSESELESVLAEYRGPLERIGGCVTDSVVGERSLAFLVVTGGTELRIMELQRERARVEPDEPVVLIAYPGRNSLAASLEVMARFHKDGVRGRICYVDGPDDEDGYERLGRTVSGEEPVEPPGDADSGLKPIPEESRQLLQGARIGLIGGPSEWLVASSPAPEMVEESWFCEIVPIEMAEVVEGMKRAQMTDIASFVASFVGGATEVVEPTLDDLENSARVYVALKEIVARHRLDALTIRCFDLVTEQGVTACLALSQLNDEGIIAGCEGDLVSTIGMLWAYRSTGQIPWMANPSRIDLKTNTLWLAHCTVPRSLVSSYKLRSHFESGIGAAVGGVGGDMQLVLVRIAGDHCSRARVSDVKAFFGAASESWCRMQMPVHFKDESELMGLAEQPLCNHLVVVCAHP